MDSAVSLDLFNIFKGKFSEQEARFIVQEFERVETVAAAKVDKEVQKEFDRRTNVLATKSDIADVRQEISKLETRMEQGFRENLKWTVATILACSALIVASITILLKLFFHQ